MTERAISVAEVPADVLAAQDDQPILYPEVHGPKDPVIEAQEAIAAADGAASQAATDRVGAPAPRLKPKQPKELAPGVAPAEEPAGRLALQLRARERALVEKQQTFSREREEFTRYRSATEEQLTGARALLTAIRTDPIAVLERHGFSREDIAARLLDGKARPEEAMSATSREVAALKQELERQKNEREQERRAVAREREERVFIDQSRADEERWPLASKYSEARLKAKGWEIAVANQAKGVRLSNEDLLDQIEEELTEIASLRGTAAPAAGKPKPTPPRPARTPVERTPPAPTLSSRGAGAQTTDDDDDVDLPMLSDQERTEQLLRAMAKSAQNGVATR